MRLITKSGRTVTFTDNPSTTALDPRLYVDPDGMAQEQRAIFARTWQLSGHVADLATPGRFVAVQVGSESALAMRGEDGELRAFRNVCRHRASRLREGRGDCGKALRCPYHGWTYRTDGRLIGVPEGRGFPGLDKQQLGLMPARVEAFAGLVFVNLDLDAQPLVDTLDGLHERLAPYGIPALERFSESTSSQPANWKIVADNYLEGYHVPIAHPSLMRLLDYQRYTVEVGEGYVYFEAPLREKPSGNRLERAYQRLVRPMPGLTDADKRVWRYVYLWPNTTIDLYPDQVTTWQINPRGIAATHDVWACYRAANPTPAMRAVQRLNHRLNVDVADEDADLVARVQSGMATTGWTPGPLGEREAAVAWFADHVRRALEAAA
jgi:phenylpropionate dioxygenase-like ring-hydroxylating dioxygenase large terminal subunit